MAQDDKCGAPSEDQSSLLTIIILLLICYLARFSSIIHLKNSFNQVYFTKQLMMELTLNLLCPVGWGCRIHRLHLCRGVRPSHKCPRYDTKKSDGDAGALGNVEHPFIAPRSTLAHNGST